MDMERAGRWKMDMSTGASSKGKAAAEHRKKKQVEPWACRAAACSSDNLIHGACIVGGRAVAAAADVRRRSA